MKNQKLIAVVFLLALAAVARFLPHPPNFSPVTAMVFLSGVILSNRLAALTLPLFFVFLTDLVIGFYPGQWMVYLAYLSIGAIGILQSRFGSNKLAWGGTVLSSAVAFFVVSNLGVWMTGTLYPRTLEGLMSCFAMAVPFFPSTLVSHVLFVGILSAVYHWGTKPLANKLVTEAS